MKQLLFALLMTGIHPTLFAQQFNQDFNADNIHYLIVANIHGDIKITATERNQILVKTKQKYIKKIENDNPEVSFIQQGDTLALYIASNCSKFSLNKPCNNDLTKWGYYDWDNCRNQTDLRVDFEIEVPSEVYAILSTINDGDINVEKMKAKIWANNINGNVSLNEVLEVSTARTINGDVDIKYLEGPSESGTFYTLNGNINAYLPKDLNADVTFKTFQGDFYTNFANAKTTPTRVESSKREDGFIYRIGGKSNIQINRGGINLDFETFNGNVYLRTI